MSYWDSPETIPLLSSLLSNLLVKSATLVFDSKSPNKKSPSKKQSLKIRQAQNILSAKFDAWKNAGKPPSKSDPTRAAYTAARSNLQRLSRYEDTLRSIKHNNTLMHCDQNDRNRIFSIMKKDRGVSANTGTSVSLLMQNILDGPMKAHLPLTRASTSYASLTTSTSLTSLVLIKSKCLQ